MGRRCFKRQKERAWVSRQAGKAWFSDSPRSPRRPRGLGTLQCPREADVTKPLGITKICFEEPLCTLVQLCLLFLACFRVPPSPVKAKVEQHERDQHVKKGRASIPPTTPHQPLPLRGSREHKEAGATAKHTMYLHTPKWQAASAVWGLPLQSIVKGGYGGGQTGV